MSEPEDDKSTGTSDEPEGIAGERTIWCEEVVMLYSEEEAVSDLESGGNRKSPAEEGVDWRFPASGRRVSFVFKIRAEGRSARGYQIKQFESATKSQKICENHKMQNSFSFCDTL